MNQLFKYLFVLWAVCFASLGLHAEVPPPPPVPDKLQPIEGPRAAPPEDASAPAVRPGSEVSIKKDGETRIEEFRIKGRLYMVRITPVIGPPYTLVDERGDGVFSRHDSRGRASTPMQWKVLSW